MAENKVIIGERLGKLREEMKKEGVDLFLAVSSDFHASEYISDYFKVTEYLSGCTSDNVVIVISQDSAKLWTDGRYFISAAGELEGTEYELMRMGEPDVPDVPEYLSEHLNAGMTLGFDGRCISVTDSEDYMNAADEMGASVDTMFCPCDSIWTDRAALPSHKVFIMDTDLVGESLESKVSKIRSKLVDYDASGTVISKLDDIMWILNIRGNDVDYNPVALSYLILGMGNIDLFIQDSELTDEFVKYAAEHRIVLHPYDKFFEELKNWDFAGNVLIDPDQTSCAIRDILEDRLGEDALIFEKNPSGILKAVKNDTEIKNSREAYLLDSVELCKFIYYIKKNIGKEKMTEVSAAEYLDNLRSKIPGYIELSFGTISAYNANAAMAHYAPSKENCAELKPEGFLLVDSGGTYEKGTTDVTRTIVLGKITDEMKKDFTTVAVSNLRLLFAKFLEGVNGVGLDTYARAPFWDRGLNFNHGTGHGIGYVLNVHEGPQSIRWRNALTPFKPGMITSDEPGIYLEGRYGIRLETITLCVPDESNEYGNFLKFEPLTFAPIDLDAILPSYMDESDVRKLNRYHEMVWKKVSPYLEGDVKDWLREATRKINK